MAGLDPAVERGVAVSGALMRVRMVTPTEYA